VKRLDKKMMYIVVAVLIVVIVVGVAAVMLLNQGGNNPATPTPTPEPVAVADADSLQFTVTDSTGKYNYYAREIGSEMDLAIQYVDPAAGFSIIFDGAEHKSWSNMTGTWTEGTFTSDWDQWYPLYEGYVDSLAHWTEGDWTDGTVTISDIAVNPEIDPSCFEVPTS
jgi:hypothetical protein